MTQPIPSNAIASKPQQEGGFYCGASSSVPFVEMLLQAGSETAVPIGKNQSNASARFAIPTDLSSGKTAVKNLARGSIGRSSKTNSTTGVVAAAPARSLSNVVHGAYNCTFSAPNPQPTETFTGSPPGLDETNLRIELGPEINEPGNRAIEISEVVPDNYPLSDSTFDKLTALPQTEDASTPLEAANKATVPQVEAGHKPSGDNTSITPPRPSSSEEAMELSPLEPRDDHDAHMRSSNRLQPTGVIRSLRQADSLQSRPVFDEHLSALRQQNQELLRAVAPKLGGKFGDESVTVSNAPQQHESGQTVSGVSANADGDNRQNPQLGNDANQPYSQRLPSEAASATQPAQPVPATQTAPVAPINTTVRSEIASEKPGITQSNPAQDPKFAAASGSPQNTTSTPLAGVQVARIVERAGEAEMHIGMRTQAFGSVDVHTALHDAQVGLSLNSEKGDLKGLLAPELPGLHAVLREQDLRLVNISFASQTGPDAQFNGGQGSHSDSGYPRPGSANSSQTDGKEPEPSIEAPISISTDKRVNVRA